MTSPSNNRCFACGYTIAREQGSFAFVDGGVILPDDVSDEEADMLLEKMAAYLDFGVHAGESDRSTVSVAVSAIAGQRQGQFELSFCGVPCIRSYFMRLIDDLERRSSSSFLGK